MSATAPSAPRRPTGNQLVRLLLRQPDCELRYRSSVPIGAWAVLKVIAGLIASSPKDGVYEPQSDLGTDGLVGWVAIKLHAFGAARHAEIGGYVEALRNARLIKLEDDGAVSLPIAAPAVTAVAAAGPSGLARVSGSPGRPPGWMTDAEKEEFKARHRAIYQAQCRMDELMARQQGKLDQGLMVMASSGDADIRIDIPDRKLAQDIVQAPALAVVGISGASHGRTEEDDSDIDISESSSSSDIRAGASEDISGRHGGDISAQDIERAMPSAEADSFAGRIVQGLTLDKAKTVGVAKLVQHWLTTMPGAGDHLAEAIGKTVDQHRKQKAEGGRGVTTANYVGKVLADILAAAREHGRLRDMPVGGGGSPPGESPAPLDPRVAAVAEWAAAPIEVRAWIGVFLDSMGLPAGVKRASKVRYDKTKHPAAFDLVAAVHPELHAICEEDSRWATDSRVGAA